jgi:TRAP-type uncharacterized transport system fused permease subunit
MGELLIGFVVFAGTLIAMGAGDFFLKLATSFFGNYRGGPAKVAVLASGFFGSFTGGPIANVVGTGSFTIPAMKKLGYSPEYAAGIEACASTGGSITPPVMGQVAFVMVVVAGVEYADVITAALLPAILYYWGLWVQVDGYAARHLECPPQRIPRAKLEIKPF